MDTIKAAMELLLTVVGECSEVIQRAAEKRLHEVEDNVYNLDQAVQGKGDK